MWAPLRAVAHAAPKQHPTTPRHSTHPTHLQILNIKEALAEKEGLEDVRQIRLLYGGKSLEDAATLESVKIEAGSQVHMVLMLRGGAAA
mgnify:CR=1 FL=1